MAKQRQNAFDRLPPRHKQLLDDLIIAVGDYATSTPAAMGRRQKKVDAVKNQAALMIQRLLEVAHQDRYARVILNLHGGIVQDVCYDGKAPIEVVVVDWDVDGDEKDHIQVDDDWCWVYHTDVAAYDPENLTQVAQAADLYRFKTEAVDDDTA